MTRLTIDDIAKIYGIPCRTVDANGREVHYVCWIDPDERTFGQFVVDEDGQLQVDPDDPSKVWEITRYGRLRLEGPKRKT